MTCATGLYNNVIKMSHFYYVFRMPNNIIGKAFTYPNAYRWLDKELNELNPVKNLADEVVEVVYDHKRDGSGSMGSTGDTANVEGVQQPEPKRTKGVKATKAERYEKHAAECEDEAITSALESLSKGYTDAKSLAI